MGFTRREILVLLFLVTGLVAGMGVRVYRQHWEPLPEISDETIQLSQTLEESRGETNGIKEDRVEERLIVNINDADCPTLEKLPGIGPVIAARIVDYRQRHGVFQAPEELMKVRGIGKQNYQRIKPFIEVD